MLPLCLYKLLSKLSVIHVIHLITSPVVDMKEFKDISSTTWKNVYMEYQFSCRSHGHTTGNVTYFCCAAWMLVHCGTNAIYIMETSNPPCTISIKTAKVPNETLSTYFDVLTGIIILICNKLAARNDMGSSVQDFIGWYVYTHYPCPKNLPSFSLYPF